MCGQCTNQLQSTNSLFVLIHQRCGCRPWSLCTTWRPNIRRKSATLWCISSVRSTTGLLCQASAVDPSRLNTAEPVSLGKMPSALPFTSFRTQICRRDLFMRSSEKWSEAQRIPFTFYRELLPPFTLAGFPRWWIKNLHLPARSFDLAQSTSASSNKNEMKNIYIWTWTKTESSCSLVFLLGSKFVEGLECFPHCLVRFGLTMASEK